MYVRGGGETRETLSREITGTWKDRLAVNCGVFDWIFFCWLPDGTPERLRSEKDATKV